MTKEEFFSTLQKVDYCGSQIWRQYFKLPGQTLREAIYIYGRLPNSVCFFDNIRRLKEDMFACFKKEFKGHLKEVIVAQLN